MFLSCLRKGLGDVGAAQISKRRPSLPCGPSEVTVQRERLERLPREACGPCLMISFSICSIPFMLHGQQVRICGLRTDAFSPGFRLSLEVSPEVIH